MKGAIIAAIGVGALLFWPRRAAQAKAAAAIAAPGATADTILVNDIRVNEIVDTNLVSFGLSAPQSEELKQEMITPSPAISKGSAALLSALNQRWARSADEDLFTLRPISLKAIYRASSAYRSNPNAVIMGYFAGPGMGLQPQYAMYWLRNNAYGTLLTLPPPPPFASWQALFADEAAAQAMSE